MNKLLERKEKHLPSYGTFIQLKTPAAVEIIASAGLDYIIVDSEHGAFGMDDICDAIMAADGAGICPLVRIPEISRRAVPYALDAGAQGLIVPAVETVEEVRQLVRYAKFTPVGNRGYAPTRDGRWGTDQPSRQGIRAYMDSCNGQTLLLPQCETESCLKQIEEITAMEGVDGIFIGPMDLSIALGVPLQVDAPVMQQAIETILRACQNHGKLAFIYCNDGETARRMADMGFDAMAVGADIFLLQGAYQGLSKVLYGK